MHLIHVLCGIQKVKKERKEKRKKKQKQRKKKSGGGKKKKKMSKAEEIRAKNTARMEQGAREKI